MRASGILMPISSLPSPYGIGCFSKEAYAFVDWLVQAGQTFWQILPLGPTGFGDSPYQSFSTFAGNPYFLDLDVLAEEGLLTPAECAGADWGDDPGRVAYDKLYENRYPLLRRAFSRWKGAQEPEYRAFQAENRSWLEDYALFMALKNARGGASWDTWEDPLRLREPEALAQAREELAGEISFQSFLQYEFARQWGALKRYANDRGVQIIGDIPIYVAFDSSDTWANPELFQLDGDRRPTGVSGVPKDGFSPTGQLWGNPLYDWDYHRASGFAWWIHRLEHCYRRYDVVRIDHFRGFDEYFAIPYGAENALGGVWKPGPGRALFDAVRTALGEKPLIAEDLGYLTDSVRQLVAQCGFPGMKVLEFAFDSRDSSGAAEYFPYNYTPNCVVYTGTHDNETVEGWYQNILPEERALVREYLGRGEDASEPLHWDMIRAAMSSVAKWCVIPMQDYLGLDNQARMNQPSTVGTNWRWRAARADFSPELAGRIRRMTACYGRMA